MKIRLLKDYNGHKAGESFIVDSEEDAQKLIDAEIAEKVVDLKTAENDKAIGKIVDDAIKAAVKETAEALKIPAVAIDHKEKSPFDSFGDFCREIQTCEVNKTRTDRMNEYENQVKAITGMGTIVNTDGGYLIPEDFSTILLTSIDEKAVLVPKTTVIPINNTIKLPYIKDEDKSASWFGGIKVYWGQEGGTLTASDLDIKHVSMTLNKIHALCYVTDELMDDSAIALGTYLNMAASIALAKEHDEMVINGNGAGQPLGIANAAALISVTKDSAQTADTITFENILNVWKRQANPANSAWLINRDCLGEIYSMTVAAAGYAPVMIANTSGGVGTLVETIFGRPIIWCEHCQTLGDAGDLYNVDLSAYLTVVKAGQARIKTASSIHVAFTTDQHCFKFTMRVDGQPWWANPQTPKHGSKTISPFVRIAARA